jgi:hypothetical protein
MPFIDIFNVSAQTWVALAASIALSAALVRIPRIFGRLAFVPVGAPVTLPIPVRAAAAATSQEDPSATYRTTGLRPFGLAEIPGAARTEVGGFRLDFFGDRACVTSAKTGSAGGTLVRVDVQPVRGALVLRARQLPDVLAWWPGLMFVVEPWRLRAYLVVLLGACAVWSLLSYAMGLRTARAAFAAAVEEIKKRVQALAADGAPPQ